MRENFTYGSVRGAAGDGSPYRDFVLKVVIKIAPHSFHEEDFRRDGLSLALGNDRCIGRYRVE